jgi:hypothetical protein
VYQKINTLSREEVQNLLLASNVMKNGLVRVTVPRNLIIGIADAAADAARDGIFKGIRIFWTRLVWSNWT